MTLQCECGGALELTAQSYPDNLDAAAFESYECASCGRTGTYTFGDGRDDMTGCVTTDGVA